MYTHLKRRMVERCTEKLGLQTCQENTQHSVHTHSHTEVHVYTEACLYAARLIEIYS